MNELERSLAGIVTSLRSLDAGFALVGGLAVSVHVAPRFTSDADLAVSVADDADAEYLVQLLRADGYEAVAVVEHERHDRLATVRLVRDSPGIVTDLLFASSGIEPEIVAAAAVIEIVAGLVVPVASVGHLMALKLLARDDRLRPVDADDLIGLAGIATETDWEAAESAVELIAARGYDRGRDVGASLASLRAEIDASALGVDPTVPRC